MGFISELFGYLLNWLYDIFNNYGIAIILFSIILRIILIPITIKQQTTMKKSAKLQGKMAEIQKKYKNNPEKLNQETIELYKSEKMSPFSGCLSSILQLVIILAVFWLVSQPLTYMKKINPEIIEKYTQIVQTEGTTRSGYAQIGVIQYAETKFQEVEKELTDITNQLEQENIANREELEIRKGELEAQKEEYNQLRLNMDFLGIDLSKVPTQSLNDWRVYIIPVLYVITSFVSIKLTTAVQTKNNKKKEVIIQENENEPSEPDPMEQMQAMNKNMTYMMPIMSVAIAIIAPLGLALYWLISNILMIIERLIINKVMEKREEEEEESTNA